MLRFVCVALALLCLLPAVAQSDPPGPPWDPLVLEEFAVIPGPQSSYVITGRVSNHDPYGLTWIELTGVYEATIGVYPDGTFVHSTIISGSGTIAARAFDNWGRWSNELTDEIY